MRLSRVVKFASVAVCAVLWLALVTPCRAGVGDPEHGRLIDAPGAKIYVEVTGGGSGRPLVLVNGGPGFDHTYLHVADGVWRALGKDRRVVFYDQRGMGRSPKLEAGQSCDLADQIEDLDAVVKSLGVDQVDLLGHSWGGYLVMAYAARHPERVHKLIIVDSAAPKFSDTKFLFRDVYPDTTAKEDAIAFSNELGDASAESQNLRLYLSMLFYSSENREKFLEVAEEFSVDLDINQRIVTDLARFDLNPELKKFRFPTLVISGRFDMNVAPAIAYAIHQAIPGSQFEIFEKSGHLPFFEQPEEFLARLREFLG